MGELPRQPRFRWLGVRRTRPSAHHCRRPPAESARNARGLRAAVPARPRRERLSHPPAHGSILDSRTWLQSLEAYCMKRVSRRQVLRLAPAAGIGLLGVALAACTPSTPTPAAPTSAPAQTSVASAAWDQLVAAAQKEGKIVVSGPPVPEARTKLPDAFKQRFNIYMDYLAVNSSQVASRIETERAAGHYTVYAR